MPLTPAVERRRDRCGLGGRDGGRVEHLGPRLGANAGSAVYDHQHGLWALYCRTGTRSYYQDAWDWCTEMQGGSLFATGSGSPFVPGGGDFHLLIPYMLDPDPAKVDCYSHEVWNPENLVGINSSCGAPAEQWGQRMISMASAYWMTGWRQPKRIIAADGELQLDRHQHQLRGGQSPLVPCDLRDSVQSGCDLLMVRDPRLPDWMHVIVHNARRIRGGGRLGLRDLSAMDHRRAGRCAVHGLAHRVAGVCEHLADGPGSSGRTSTTWPPSRRRTSCCTTTTSRPIPASRA